jgi:hypothetical protein
VAGWVGRRTQGRRGGEKKEKDKNYKKTDM